MRSLVRFVTKIRASEIRASEIRVSKIRVREIRVREIRVSKIRVSEIRISSNHRELHGAIFGVLVSFSLPRAESLRFA